MRGLHLTADLYECACQPQWLVEAGRLRGACIEAIGIAGLTVVTDCFHTFGGGGGVTGTVLLAESHVAFHTWPELRSVTLDVYVCNYSADNTVGAEQLMQRLVDVFQPGRAEYHRLLRGSLGLAAAEASNSQPQ